MRMLRTLLLVLGLLTTMAAPVAAQPNPFPDVIDLPGGFFPEGIAIGDGPTAYVGSLIDGAIWEADLATGSGEILVPGVEGRLAVGMSYDSRAGHLFVAGGSGAAGYVYDTATGAEVAVVEFSGAGFVNDVIVTKNAAYFTDSFAPQLYAVPLNGRGLISGNVKTIPLTGDFQFEPGQFNSNGIEATANGKTLIVVNSFFGEIYKVNARTGVADAIDLGGTIVNGDGLVLMGRTLYAVEGGKNQVTKIALTANLSSGSVVDAIVDEVFDVPTTAGLFGNSLYVVSAKFNTPPLPTTPYEIVKVDA